MTYGSLSGVGAASGAAGSAYVVELSNVVGILVGYYSFFVSAGTVGTMFPI